MSSIPRRATRTRARRATLGLEQLERRYVLAGEVEPNNTPAQASPATFGESWDGIVGQLTSLADIDYYKVRVEAGDTLVLQYGKTGLGNYATTPQVDLFDASGSPLGSLPAGDSLEWLSPVTADYFIRISGLSAFGEYTREYGIQARILDGYSITLETEPNDSAPQANPITYTLFSGALSSSSDLDNYSFNATGGARIAFKFWNEPARNPAIRVRNSAGDVVIDDQTGAGVVFVVPQTGAYTIEVRADNAAGTVTGGYMGQIVGAAANRPYVTGTQGLSDAAAVALTSQNMVILGNLSAVGARQTFAFDVDESRPLYFAINEGYGSQGRLLRLFDADGRQIASQANCVLSSIADNMLFTPGKYYLSVEATTPVALGPYALDIHEQRDTMAAVRGVPQVFYDFTGQVVHNNSATVQPYGNPAAIDYLQGTLRSRWAAYDVDYTSQLSSRTSLAMGVGKLTSTGNPNYGNIGDRVPYGDSIVGTSETTWPTSFLSYGRGADMFTALGSILDLGPVRQVADIMSSSRLQYQWPIGETFPAVTGDESVGSTFLTNQRAFLDAVLQPGRNLGEREPNDLAGSAQSLAADLADTRFEMTPGGQWTTGSGPSSIVSGDFNHDGRVDVAVSNVTPREAWIYLGNGDGTLQTPLARAAGTYLQVAAGDLDGDTFDDLILGDRIYWGSAAGPQTAFTTLGTSAEISHLVLADINQDGRRDVLIATNTGLLPLLNNGNRTFQVQSLVPVATATQVAVADINHDSFPDVALNTIQQRVALLLGVGNGTFQAPTYFNTDGSSYSTAFWDQNADGQLDLVIDVGSQKLVVYPGTGTGEFQSPVEHAFAYTGSDRLAVADLSGDGLPDLSVGATVYLARADGVWPAPIKIATSLSNTALGDLNGDGRLDVLSLSITQPRFDAILGAPNDARNDRVVVDGRIASAADIDLYTFPATAGQRWYADIDAAEFQELLDAKLTIYDPSGAVVAQNAGAVDADSGIASVDPYLSFVAATSGTYKVAVASQRGTAGNYTLKLMPGEAISTRAPRVLATLPAGASSTPATRQITILLDDILDPASITSANIIVQGTTSGVRAGTAVFDPLESILVWTADSALPVDTYTVTLKSGAAGLRDPFGNTLDGETDGSFVFPEVSGNGAAGGDFNFSFAISATNTSPAAINTATYAWHPHSRGLFTFDFNDALSLTSVAQTAFTLHSAGADGYFDSADDRFDPLDAVIEKLTPTKLYLFSRGVPDSGNYRVEGTFLDAAGNSVVLSRDFLVQTPVPASAYFVDQALTQRGVQGTYFAKSLQDQTTPTDWRTRPDVGGTRTDAKFDYSSYLDFATNVPFNVSFNNAFSVQWDAWVQVPVDGTKLYISGSSGNRLQIDINHDGAFNTTGDEFLDNGFAAGAGSPKYSVPLAAGVYQIRVQAPKTVTLNASLQWLTPDYAITQPGTDQLTARGTPPVVTGLNFQPGLPQPIGLDRIDVQFSTTIAQAALTPANFRLRYSPNASFYDGDEVLLTEKDGTIAWNAAKQTATFEPAAPLLPGFYRVELNAEAGGITGTNGYRLDGEYLNTAIAGSSLLWSWSQSISGNGIQGGDYIAPFSIDTTPRITGIENDTGAASDDAITSDTTLKLFGRASPGALVSLARTGVGAIGSVTANAQGDWTFDYAAVTLPAGTYAFTASVVSADGPLVSPAYAVTIDLAAPTAPQIVSIGTDSGTSATDFITNDNRIIIRGTAEPGGLVSVLRAGVGQIGTVLASASGNWTLNYESQALADGLYTFSATVTDPAGWTSPLSATQDVRIDTTAPATPVMLGITTDSGISSTDRITSDTTPALFGTAEPNSQITVTRSSCCIGSQVVFADAAGNWTYQSPGVGDSSFTFSVQATDAAGNLSSVSAPFAVTVDTQAPPSPSFRDVIDDTGSSNTDEVTRDDRLLIRGFSDTSVVSVTVSIAGVGVIGTASSAFGQWTFDYTGTALANGTYNFTATGTDAAGNTSTSSSSFQVVVDLLPPVGYLPVEIEPNDTLAWSNVEIYHNQPTPRTRHLGVFRGTLSTSSDVDYAKLGTLEAGETLTISASGLASKRGANPNVALELYRSNGNTFPLVIADDDGGIGEDSLIYQFPITITDTYTLKVRASNSAQTSQSGTYQVGVVLDNLGSSPGQLGAGFADEFESNNNPQSAQLLFWQTDRYDYTTQGEISTAADVDYYQFSFSAAEFVSFELRPNSGLLPLLTLYNSAGTELARDSDNSTGNASIYSYRIPSDGVYYVRAAAALAGSTGAYTLYSFIYKSIAQGSIIPPTIIPENDSGSSNTDSITSDSTPTFVMVGIGVPGNGGQEVYVDGVLTLTTANSGTITYTPAALADGQHTITSRPFDLAGNFGAMIPTRTFWIDTQLPTISSIGAQATAEDTPTSAIALTVGDAGTAAGQLILTASSTNSTLLPAGSFVFGGSGANRTLTISPAANRFGSATVTVTVKDVAGNAATSQFAFSVTSVPDPPDFSPLVFTVAENATGAALGSFVTTDPDTGDTVSLSLADPRFAIAGLALQLAPGVSLDFEATLAVTFDVTATDTALLTRTRAVTVNVTNVNEAPTAILLSNLSAPEHTPGAVVGNVTVIDPDANDTFTLTISDNRFEIAAGALRLKPGVVLDAFETPSIPVTLSASDAFGLSISADVLVQVVDINDPPLAVWLSHDVLTLELGSSSTIAVQGIDPDLNDSLTFVASDDHFEIVEGQLRARLGSLGFSDEYTLVPLTIEAVDSGGARVAASFVITVVNRVLAPRFSLSPVVINERTPGAVAAQLSTLASPGTIALEVSDDRFEVIGDELRLKPNIALDFETEPFVSVTVIGISPWGASSQTSISLAVADVNEPPTSLRLSQPSAARGVLGAWLGSLSAIDPDAGDRFSFRSTDPRLAIGGDDLFLAADFALAKETTWVSLTAIDAAGNELTQQIPLHSVAAPPWQHAHQWLPNPNDVNADGQVTPLDALLIIQHLNDRGAGALEMAAGGTWASRFVDVSGDDQATPLDALLVINALNGRFKEMSRPAPAAAAETSADAENPLSNAWWYWIFNEGTEEP